VVTASHDEKIGLPAFKILRETLDLIAFDNDALSDNSMCQRLRLRFLLQIFVEGVTLVTEYSLRSGKGRLDIGSVGRQRFAHSN
jgi:hypothetical protein